MNSLLLIGQETVVHASNRATNPENSQATNLSMHTPAIPHFNVSRNGEKPDLRLTDYDSKRILDFEMQFSMWHSRH